MNILIVHAHPEPLSFTTSLKTAAQQTFKKLGHQVEISDLYAMQFNPVASKEDFLELNQPDYFNYALEQRNATKQQLLATDIQAEIDKVKRAD
ncbi:NAD(P)H-dependent oxidoreductase, partial [Acinetobacter baumannii]|nr:NAD(P)H-dependent oxidoreductase [Acinetobacter baumannii]EKW6573644.1 NAD(P)H-dependent oxidoreductase [Acinetobacter baumannii]EKW8758755.1 NAD(P)H-dependent oxidoreductase [Acinetobacter baumannii]